jgi:LPS-assembly lipoprotein
MTAMCSLLRQLAVAALLLSIAGCGFHPRGSGGMSNSLAVTYIQGAKPWSSIYEDFRDALEDHGVTVTGQRDEATAVLKIMENKSSTDVLSVDIGGKVQELLLVQMVRFKITARDQQVLLEEQTVTAKRDFVFNKNDILAKERESRFIRRALQRDVVNLAMLRVMTVVGDDP